MLYADTGNVLLKLSMPMNQNSVLVAGTTPSWSSTPSLDSLTLRSTGSLTLGLSGPGGNTGQIILRNSANTNTLTLQSGASSSSYTLTLPVAAPGANQYLQFTSGGVASWVNGTVVGVTTVGAFSGSAQTNGASISGSTITFGPASATVPGMVSTGTQTFAGAKTLSSGLTISATTNQLVLGTTNTTTITSTAPAASRVYTIPDAGTTASFIMTEGAQNIVGAKTFTGSAGPLIFSQTGAGTFTAPAVGATPSAGTRIVIAPGDASNFANGIGWNTSYEFWLSSRQNITFYPNNSASRVAEFTSITGTAINITGVKGINFINGFSAFDPVLNAGAGWIKFINWNDNSGNGAPSLTARSAGTRIVLVASANGSTVSDTAIGNVQEGGGGTNYTSMWFMAAREIFFHTNSSATEIFRINSTGLSYKGTQVVSSRITAWGTPGGTLTRATIAPDVAATPTAAQFNALAQNVRALITDLRSHGLIGT